MVEFSRLDILQEGERRGMLSPELQQELSDLQGAGAEAAAAPAPEAGIGGDAPPSTFAGRVGDAFMTRETFAAAGGMIGGVAGAPLGPGGMIAGGGLGAAAGSATFDSLTSLNAMLRDRPQDVVPMREQFEAMGHEGMMDMAFSVGGAVFQPIRIGRHILGKMSGVTSEASVALQETARRLGINLGAVDVGTGLPRAAARILGVFPFTGTPFRTAQRTKLQEAGTAVDRMLDTFAPNGRMASELGVDMTRAAQQTHRTFKSIASDLYGRVESSIAAASRQDIIPTRVVHEDGSVGGLKQFAEDFATDLEAGLVVMEGGEALPRAVRQATDSFITMLRELPELITPQQYRRVMEDLSDLIQANIRDGADVRQLTMAKDALEEGMANIRMDLLPAGEGEAIRNALDAANTFYAKGIMKFQTTAAQDFERVDRFIFRPGAPDPGNLNADEIARVAVNLRSPQQIQDLANLVGRRNMQQVAALHFREAVESAAQTMNVMGQDFRFINPDILERQLGLVAGARGQQQEGIRALYRFAGVDLDDVRGLLDSLRAIEGIADPAEFVRRRIILGGVAAATAVGGVGVAGLPGAGAMVAMTVIARHASSIFSDPRKLKQMRAAFDEGIESAAGRAAMARVIRALAEEDADNEFAPPSPPGQLGGFPVNGTVDPAGLTDEMPEGPNLDFPRVGEPEAGMDMPPFDPATAPPGIEAPADPAAVSRDTGEVPLDQQAALGPTALVDSVEREEGRESRVYVDTEGNPSIGVGFNLNRADADRILREVGADPQAVRAGEAELTDQQIDAIRDFTINEAIERVQRQVPGFDQLDEVRQHVLIDMVFNMGSITGFRRMLEAIAQQDWERAAAELLDSHYAQQVPNRARGNAMRMRSGMMETGA
jgi:GH24 family phage-related lysozyme (muramidase)